MAITKLERRLEALDRWVERLVVLLVAAMVVAGFLQVANRFVLNVSLSWSEELQRYLNIWIVFLAVPIGYRRGAHLGMNMLFERLPPLSQRALLVLQELLWLALAVAIAWFATRIMVVARNQTSSTLGVTMDKIYLAQVVGGAYLALVALRRLATRLTPWRLIELR
jgi:TRAP-type C4-dicarboxylate transport system permease small subunit